MTKTNYPIGDFFIRLKNGVMAGNKKVLVEKTKFIKSAAALLKSGGYLDEIVEKEDGLEVSLAYRRKRPVITDIQLMSKPGLRVYMKHHEIKAYKKPYNLVISTPEGLMFTADAVKKNMGGEVVVGIL